MRKEKKWVYYCDFCKKHSLRSLKEHEAHCTMNPHRSCRLCDLEHDYPALIERVPFKEDNECLEGLYITVKGEDLMGLADGCPVCALTILRLFLKKKGSDGFVVLCEFQFKAELEKWWREKGDNEDWQDCHR